MAALRVALEDETRAKLVGAPQKKDVSAGYVPNKALPPNARSGWAAELRCWPLEGSCGFFVSGRVG